MIKHLITASQLIIVTLLLLIFCSCQEEIPATPKDLTKEALIPKPSNMSATGSSYRLTSATTIYVDGSSEEVKAIGQQLANQINPATGFNLKVVATDTPPSDGIFFTLNKKASLGKEGYDLNIENDKIVFSANQPDGLYRGIHTLIQLLPARINATSTQEGPWEIASGNISDQPEFEYRGAMLDVSRHFFGVKDVKRVIDLIAKYKLNVLHLHLADDQGWRIEIKSWPNLTKVGGSTEVGGGEGGFFTQEDYKEIVRYAAERYIMIVPEIDMPGHTNAALASYAELNCDGKATELYTGTEVGFSTLCTDKEITYKFIDDVFRELAAITPGPYLHIGGDESHATKKDDYIKFITRVQGIVSSHGKQMMGWDDIIAGDIKTNAVVQHWAKEDNAKAAVEKNVKIVMSPAKKAYLDMQYDSTSHLGLHWAAYIEIDDGYNWNPNNYITEVKKENILGIEAPLWTETVTNMDELEYLVFPRLPGYAELSWTDESKRDWNEYKVRLGKQKSRFEIMGVDYYQSKMVPWTDEVETVIPKATGL